MKSRTTLDLTRDFPRSGRAPLAGFAWLGRTADKARAKRGGTLGEYISLCPMDQGFLERCGVSEATFLDLIAQGVTDDELATYFERHVAPKQRDAANRWVLADMAGHLDEQDREEKRAA